MEKLVAISNCNQCRHSSSTDDTDEFGNSCWKLGRKIPINVSIPDDCPLPDAPTQQSKVEQRADNSQSDAIALLAEIVRSADLFGHYHLTAGCHDYERINAVLAQQHT